MTSHVLLASRLARTIPAAAMATRRRLTTSQTLRLKESESHSPDPDKLEKHKQDSLAKQKSGRGHWKPELASDSEESIRADRHGPAGKATDASLAELQAKTKKHAEETAKAGTSLHDGHGQ